MTICRQHPGSVDHVLIFCQRHEVWFLLVFANHHYTVFKTLPCSVTTYVYSSFMFTANTTNIISKVSIHV